MREVLAGGFKLQKPQNVHDRSAPSLFREGQHQLKKGYNRRFLMEAVRQQQHRLNHVLPENCRDRSAPKIARDAHIRIVDRRTFLDGILVGAQCWYTRVIDRLASSASSLASSAISIRSSANSLVSSVRNRLLDTPEALNFRKSLIGDIEENRAQLRHIRDWEKNDRSRPFVASSYALESSRKNAELSRKIDEAHGNLMNEVRSGRSLNHVLFTGDTSKKILSGKYNLHKWDRKKLLSEIRAPHQLSSVAKVCDRSAPVINQQGHFNLLQNNQRKQLLAEVKTGVQLEHVGGGGEVSAPRASV